jgi:hypothetical protein
MKIVLLKLNIMYCVYVHILNGNKTSFIALHM